MRIRRDISATDLIKLLKQFGYTVTRQSGSHIRLTTTLNGEHHLTIPNHDPIKIGTLGAIIASVAAHQDLTKEQTAASLFQ